MNAVSSQNHEQASWEASVSSWVDGESDIRADELDTPYGRQVWDTYNLIGDVMRSSDLAFQPSDRFYAKLSAAIDEEPLIVAPISFSGGKITRFVLPGLAVAAVASFVWLAQPMIFNNLDEPQVVAQASTVLANADNDKTTIDTDDFSLDPHLADYMAAHQAMAGAGPMRQVSYEIMGGGR